MDYKYLEQGYQDDVLAENLYHREREHFGYSLNIANFERMLADDSLPGELRADLQNRLVTEKREMAKVEAVYAALQSQITDPIAHAAAVKRVKAKRIAAGG